MPGDKQDNRRQTGTTETTSGPLPTRGRRGALLRRLACWLAILPVPTLAEGWGNVGKDADKGFSWTAPLWPDFWMAWTPATLAVFLGIFGAMAVLTVLEVRHPGGDERLGILGLTTTRGDRLFITLLGTSYIFLAWLGLVGMPLWGPLGLAILWGIFTFWKV
jgi:predicted small integral membrane protein